MRADTTVVEANVAYPTDSGLLAKGVAKHGRSWRRSCRRWGWRPGRRWPDRTRSVRRRARSIGAYLRRRNDDASAEVRRINGELAGIADARRRGRPTPWSATPAATLRRVGDQATGRAAALVAELERTAAVGRTDRRADPARLAGEHA